MAAVAPGTGTVTRAFLPQADNSKAAQSKIKNRRTWL
jgi:hypothetical protein